MKKITLLSIAIVTLSFASCKKDYTCTCKDATGGEVKTFTKVSKKQALANCQSRTFTDTTPGSSNTAQAETCTLSK